MSKVSFSQTVGTFPVVVVRATLEPYQLNLRSAFGNNALITIQIGPFSGYGEVGLPPKKPLCYLADYNDIESYFNEYNKHLATYPREIADYDPFNQLENRFFQSCRQEKESDDRHLKIIRLLFRALDECPANSQPSSRAARCGIEAALLDLWGKFVQKPVFELIGAENPSGKPSFFTAALNTDISLIIDSTKGGFQSTPYIKIKLDADVEKGFQILEALRAEFDRYDIKKKWSIDANSAWTPEISMKYLELLGKEPFKSIIYMLEQPFPVELTKVEPISKEEIQKWKEVKEAYEKVGILVYADESVSLAEDIEKLLPIVHGVNIKLEKAGGIREALRAICVAQKHELKIWIGMMVASRLSCNIPVHLFSFTDKGGDLDGSLLIQEQSHLFDGGFEWIPIDSRGNNENHGLIKFPANGIGFGVNYKKTTTF